METETIELKISDEEAERVAGVIASEIVRKIYYEFIFLRYLPEIKLIKKGKVRAKSDNEIDEFIRKRIASL